MEKEDALLENGGSLLENGDSLLVVRDIVKTFPGVQALKGVSMDVRAGEVHALVGENGAGKSTLMKCLIGIQSPTSGEIYFDGKLRHITNTAQALNIGISMIHQELNPVLHRPIMENIWLGREPKNRLGLVDHKRMFEKTKELLESLDMTEDPNKRMVELTVAKMQMIEIAKAISYNAKLVIMDEPTSSLTDREVGQLFKIIHKLKEQNIAVIYISHKMDEIYQISDRITVFRDGALIGTREAKELPMNEMIGMMVGRKMEELFSKKPVKPGEVMLEVKGLSCHNLFRDVSFTVRRGEILGMAGLVGAGRTEVAETVFGVRHATAGEILIKGKRADIRSPRDAIKNGMAFLTEDRRQTGIFPMLSVEYNMSVSHMKHYIRKNGLLSFGRMHKDCREYREDMSIKTPSMEQQIQFLSGGNQQKVLVARWLLTQPDILFLDEPTRGIDVGAKAEIYRLIERLAGEGKSIVMISSELPEIMGLSDRILVMHEGEVTGVLENRELEQEAIMTLAIGAQAAAADAD